MTAPHIVNPAGLLGEALAETSPDLMRSLLQSIINALLSADAELSSVPSGPAVAGPDDTAQRLPPSAAGHQSRHDRRRDPQAPQGHLLPRMAPRDRKSSESALITVVADCYVAGVSTRRMDKLVKTLGIDSLSKSQVSRMATDLDSIVEDFRHRPLGEAGPFTFVTADALRVAAARQRRQSGCGTTNCGCGDACCA